MESYRGPNGGVRLAKTKNEIRLYDIVAAIDGTDLFHECVLGLPGCGNRKPCALHDKWKDHRCKLKRMLRSTSLQELVDENEHSHYRLRLDPDFD